MSTLKSFHIMRNMKGKKLDVKDILRKCHDFLYEMMLSEVFNKIRHYTVNLITP